MSRYPSYGRAGRARAAVIAMIYFASFAAVGVAFWKLPKDAAKFVAGATVVVLFVIVFVLRGWSDRRRLHKLRTMLDSRGFALEADNLTPTRRRWAIERFGAYSQLRNDLNDIRWIAAKPVPLGECVALRSTYLASSGRSTYEVTTMLVAAPTAENGPAVWVHRKLFGLRPAPGQEVAIGDEAFDRRYRILTHDPAVAKRVLTTAVRELIVSGPKFEWWNLGAGLVVCNFTTEVDAKGLHVMVQRTAAMAELLAATC